MKLTELEQKVCLMYSAPRIVFQDGKAVQRVNCPECPLVVDKEQHLCKKNMSKKEYEKRIKECYENYT